MSKQILVPVDGSIPSLNAVKEAIVLAKALKYEVVISSIVIPYDLTKILDNVKPKGFPRYPGDGDSAAGKVVDPKANYPLETAKRVVKECDFDCVSYRELIDYDPATKIIAQAKSLDVAMIVIGNRGLGAFENLLLGSVSNKIAQYAKCPVMIVK